MSGCGIGPIPYDRYRIAQTGQTRLNLDALLPFVPVLQGGQKLPIIEKAVQLLRQDERLQELEPLLAFFATFVLETNTVRKIMRWDMAVLRESPWYEEIVQEGYLKGQEIGRLEGREEGREEGERHGLLTAIELALEIKFGADGVALVPAVRQVTGMERLQQLYIRLIAGASLDEFRYLCTEP
jgi:predicted transposase YdaD